MTTGRSEIREVAAEIRPGVLRPDWTAVTTPVARDVLRGRQTARSSPLEDWTQALEADEDLIWRSVLRLYAEAGRAPRSDELATAAGMPEGRVKELLRKLRLCDLIGADPETATIRYAYPFTEAASGHRVELNGRSLNALCAIDALGVGAMYRADAPVTSSCRLCSETIRITTSGAGRALQSVAPEGAVVWYDYAYAGSASSSCCPVIAFFCSDEHLRRWLDGQTPQRRGARLAMDEALELGRAIFGPVLRQKGDDPREDRTGLPASRSEFPLQRLVR